MQLPLVRPEPKPKLRLSCQKVGLRPRSPPGPPVKRVSWQNEPAPPRRAVPPTPPEAVLKGEVEEEVEFWKDEEEHDAEGEEEKSKWEHDEEEHEASEEEHDEEEHDEEEHEASEAKDVELGDCERDNSPEADCERDSSPEAREV